MEKKNWINVFVLGFGFFLLFSAFQTTMFIQTLTISSYLSPKCNHSSTFGVVSQGLADKVGYISGAIIYLMVAVGNWVSVSIVAVFGAKWSLVVSGALYVIYIACLIRPLVYTIFAGAFILGAGGGVLWTAQGQILIQNSSKEKMSTTSGIFWFMLQMSLVVGSIYVFAYWYIFFETNDHSNSECFPPEQNMILFGVLTFIAITGIVVMVFIMPVRKQGYDSISPAGSVNSASSGNEKEPLMRSNRPSPTDYYGKSYSNYYLIVLKSLKNAVNMLLTKKMILLCFTFVYTGYELNFWSGVYGTVMGHTLAFPKYIVGASLFFIGLGEIIAGGLFGIFGSYTNRWGRDNIVLFGFACHIACFFLTFLFLPEDAISTDVHPENSYGALGVYFVYSNIFVALANSFLLGFGDACFNTQIYSIIGVLYPTDDQSAPAMALYKFFQSITAMVGFFTSTLLQLHWQLLILVVLAVVGTLTFFVVEWEYHRNEIDRERNLTTSYEEPNDNRYPVEKNVNVNVYRESSKADEDGFISDSSAY